ncbi:TPA: hypothetical protein ACKP9S_002791 [Pseudomonas aeruginosa]
MKFYAAVLPIAVAGILTGCAAIPLPDSTSFTDAGQEYQYQMTTSTMRFANASPLEFEGGSESTRVLALFGMPDFQVMKPGKFTNDRFATSEMGETKSFIAPTQVAKAKSTGPTNTDLAAVSVNALSTTGLSAGTVGAAGAALMIAGTDTSPDPRTTYGAAICYMPVTEQPDLQRGYVACFNQVVEDLSRALGPNAKVVDHNKVVTVEGNVEAAGAGKQPVTMLVSRLYNHAAVGYAPADKGGFKANIYAIQVKRFVDNTPSKATVEEIGQALRVAKRPTVAYRLTASDDYRKRKDVEPIGVY